MRPTFTLLLLFSVLSVFSQCKDSSLVKAWGKWHELQYNSTIYRLEHRTSDSILPANIRKMVKDALIERCGENFYSKIRLKDLSIVIPLQKKQHSDDLIAEEIIKKGEIKYYYSFLFFESPNIEYRFNIVLDVQGNILNEWAVPKIRENEVNRFVPFCEAITIAKNDKKTEIKKINDISLMYDPKLNYFAWKTTIGFKYHQDDSHYKSYRLTINAFTGEIIDRWDADVKKYDDPTHK